MPTLLSNGISMYIAGAPPPCLPCASGGAARTIFSWGRCGGTSRAGRWNASRLKPLLLSAPPGSAGAPDLYLGDRQLSARARRRRVVDQLDRDPVLADRERSRRRPGARIRRLVQHEARQGGAVLPGQDEERGGGRPRVLRLLRRGPVDHDSALGHRLPGRKPPRGDGVLALAGLAGRRDRLVGAVAAALRPPATRDGVPGA